MMKNTIYNSLKKEEKKKLCSMETYRDWEQQKYLNRLRRQKKKQEQEINQLENLLGTRKS